ncbi:MAG TPA: hypothetical protein VHZ24_13115 [Pirellulales bacterium]|nr:hypothetical protein [Pirellulales bacterium]
MSPAKPRTGDGASSNGSLWQIVATHWRAIAAVVLAVAAIGAGRWTWQSISTRLAADPRYRLDPQQITMTPKPEWVRADVLAEVLRDGSLDNGPSLLDPRLAQRAAKAFEMHPWVARTLEVRKLSPAGLDVRLEYRRPACMVEVPGGLFAVDEHAVLLPSADFGAADAQKYPRLSGISTITEGPVGTRWEDPIVQGGAQVAAAVAEVWQEYRFVRIVPSAMHGTTASHEPQFEILTRRGTRVRWGYAPSADLSGEPTAAEKLARLKKYVAAHGSLDPANGAVDLDLRHGGDIVATPRMAAADDDSQKR